MWKMKERKKVDKIWGKFDGKSGELMRQGGDGVGVLKKFKFLRVFWNTIIGRYFGV